MLAGRLEGKVALVTGAAAASARRPPPLTETSAEDFRRVMDINVTGVFLGMRTVAPAMIERRAGLDRSTSLRSPA